jgi:glycosyltransferase involved in cell wall biosynthesis
VALKHDTKFGERLRADWERRCPVEAGEAAIRSLAAGVDVLLAWGIVDREWGFSRADVERLIPRGLHVIEVSHGSVEHPGFEAPLALARSTPVAVSRAAIRGLPAPKRADARVIWNQVSPDRVEAIRPRDEVRAAWGISPGGKVAGWLGRLSWEKGPRAFVDGIAALPPDWSGVMVGGSWPAAEEEIRAQAERVAPGRIHFAGQTRDVGSALAAFDRLVMTSETEACSIAAAEAWLAGVPLVSTPVGMLEDHPWLARLMPARPTGEQVAAAILDDPDAPTRARAARQFARVELSPARFGREWTDLICRLGPKPIRRAAVSAKVSRDIDLMLARRNCPDAKKAPGCGCNDTVLCGRDDNAEKTRAMCYQCIEQS